MFEMWQYPQHVRVARFTSTQQQSDLWQHFTSIRKVHLPFSTKLHTISSMSSLASLSSFDLQSQNLMPFSRHDHTVSSTHDHTTNTVCHSQLIYGFIQTQHHVCRHRLYWMRQVEDSSYQLCGEEEPTNHFWFPLYTLMVEQHHHNHGVSPNELTCCLGTMVALLISFLRLHGDSATTAAVMIAGF